MKRLQRKKNGAPAQAGAADTTAGAPAATTAGAAPSADNGTNISAWLEDFGAERYTDAFRTRCWNTAEEAAAAGATEADLQAMGVKKLYSGTLINALHTLSLLAAPSGGGEGFDDAFGEDDAFDAFGDVGSFDDFDGEKQGGPQTSETAMVAAAGPEISLADAGLAFTDQEEERAPATQEMDMAAFEASGFGSTFAEDGEEPPQAAEVAPSAALDYGDFGGVSLEDAVSGKAAAPAAPAAAPAAPAAVAASNDEIRALCQRGDFAKAVGLMSRRVATAPTENSYLSRALVLKAWAVHDERTAAAIKALAKAAAAAPAQEEFAEAEELD